MFSTVIFIHPIRAKKERFKKKIQLDHGRISVYRFEMCTSTEMFKLKPYLKLQLKSVVHWVIIVLSESYYSKAE